MRNWILKNSNRVRHILNLWPPFLFSGIRITEISPDYRRCRAELKNWPGTRNANGSQFGGSQYGGGGGGAASPGLGGFDAPAFGTPATPTTPTYAPLAAVRTGYLGGGHTTSEPRPLPFLVPCLHVASSGSSRSPLMRSPSRKSCPTATVTPRTS